MQCLRDEHYISKTGNDRSFFFFFINSCPVSLWAFQISRNFKAFHLCELQISELKSNLYSLPPLLPLVWSTVTGVNRTKPLHFDSISLFRITSWPSSLLTWRHLKPTYISVGTTKGCDNCCCTRDALCFCSSPDQSDRLLKIHLD